jgi:hypothetical protein
MNKGLTFLSLLLVACLAGCGTVSPTPPPAPTPTLSSEGASPALLFEGEYLGQPRPGLTPELFAPEVFAVDGSFGHHLHSSLYFSPDGREVYFTDQSMATSEVLPLFMRQEDERWTAPQIAPFVGIPRGVTSQVFAPDWSRIYLYVSPPPEGNASTQQDTGFWYMERTVSGWSRANHVGSPENLDRNEGTLYFSANLPGGFGDHDLYRTRFLEGRYTDPENLGEAVNTAAEEYLGCAAPDGSYLIFYRFDPANKAAPGLYLTFRVRDETWTGPVPLDDELSLEAGFAASLSPDGTYLFLLDRGLGIYWVDARVVESFRGE